MRKRAQHKLKNARPSATMHAPTTRASPLWFETMAGRVLKIPTEVVWDLIAVCPRHRRCPQEAKHLRRYMRVRTCMCKRVSESSTIQTLQHMEQGRRGHNHADRECRRHKAGHVCAVRFMWSEGRAGSNADASKAAPHSACSAWCCRRLATRVSTHRATSVISNAWQRVIAHAHRSIVCVLSSRVRVHEVCAITEAIRGMRGARMHAHRAKGC